MKIRLKTRENRREIQKEHLRMKERERESDLPLADTSSWILRSDKSRIFVCFL